MFQLSRILLELEDGVIFTQNIEPLPLWSVPGMSICEVEVVEELSFLVDC